MSQGDIAKEHEATDKNVFAMVMNGDLGLPLTYWGLGVAGVFILGLFLGVFFSAISSSLWALIPCLLAYVGYWVFVSIAIWKASNRYTGRKGWAILAKITIVLGALRLLSSAVSIESSAHISEDQVTQVAERANRSLPRMIDDSTKLDRVSAEGKQLTYHYELVGRKSSEVDASVLNKILRPQLTSRACGNVEAKSLLQRGVSLAYGYSGSDRVLIANIVVTSSDCRP